MRELLSTSSQTRTERTVQISRARRFHSLSPRQFSQIVSEIQEKRFWCEILTTLRSIEFIARPSFERTQSHWELHPSSSSLKNLIHRQLASKRVSPSSIFVGHFWRNSSQDSSIDGLTSDEVCRSWRKKPLVRFSTIFVLSLDGCPIEQMILFGTYSTGHIIKEPGKSMTKISC